MEWGFISTLFSYFLASLTMTDDVIMNVDKQVWYVWATYVAEASIEKELLELKTYDIDSVDQMNTVASGGPRKDMEYGFLNAWADTGYFDLEVNNSPSADIDLWKIVWGDVVLESINFDDYFDTFVLNYNKWDTSDVLMEIISWDKSGSFERCDFDNYVDEDCLYIEKEVINTSDSTMDGMLVGWYQVYYRTWDNNFDNQLYVQWFNPGNKNYRITFSTLKWESVDFSYFVERWGEKKMVVNNFIEIDTVWNAIDNFSRMKLEKRISNNMQPNSKYVIFSNWEIAK